MLKNIASSNLEQVRPSAFVLFLAIGEQKCPRKDYSGKQWHFNQFSGFILVHVCSDFF